MSSEKRWTSTKYNEFLEQLYSRSDLRYKKFHSGLGINYDYLIGIPVPECKKIAKELSKGDYSSFIKINTHTTYEEILIHGLIIGYIKRDFNDITILLEQFIPYIDNWALCDIVITNMHIWKYHLQDGLPFITKCINSQNQWHKRVGYVLLLDYYINNDYLDTIFRLCDQNKSVDYYVQMAIAWLISICYVKYPNQTVNYLTHDKIDDWTHNKAIQKIRESKRVTDKQKKDILRYKRVNKLK